MSAPTTGSAPVTPLTLCAVTAALDGHSQSAPAPEPARPLPRSAAAGSQGAAATVPVTICGIKGPLGGSVDAVCPQPTTECIHDDPTPGPPERRPGPRQGPHADTGVVGLQPFAGQHADRRNGGLERLVVGVDGRTTPARGVDRAGFAGRAGPSAVWVAAVWAPCDRLRTQRGSVSGSSRRSSWREGTMFTNLGMLVTPEAWRTSFIVRLRASSRRDGGRGSPVPTSPREDALFAKEFGRPPHRRLFLCGRRWRKGAPTLGGQRQTRGDEESARPRCQSNPGRSSPSGGGAGVRSQ